MLSSSLTSLLIYTLLFATQQPSDSNDSNSTEQVRATHYGTSYHGQRMGCGGVYDTNNPYILAVGPSRYNQIPCGTLVDIEGPNGTLYNVPRTDSCPGCSYNLIDLSEAGHTIVCGVGTCTVTITIQRIQQDN